MGIVGVEKRVRRCRLRWFGHVKRKSDDDWVSKCRRLIVEGQRGRDRGRKTWMECVVEDMERLKLRKEDAQDRVVVHAAKEVERKEFTKKLHTADERGNVFRIANC